MSFQIADPNKIDGTCLIGYIEISPVNLIKKFGFPNMCDGYKVSGEYAFEDENGDVFTLYDWKYTTLYDSENTYTPEEFWKLKHPMEFNIGGNSKHNLNKFKRFVKTARFERTH